MKKVLVLGASGSTGRLLVENLLQRRIEVIAIVRDKDSMVGIDNSHSALQLVEAEITKITEGDLAHHLTECEAILSCLGHNLTFKGIFGPPRRLVFDAVKKVANAIGSLNVDRKFKIILMNTTGNSNRDLLERPPYSQRLVIFLLRWLLPPHTDNEQAADFLRTQIGQKNKNIEWVVVRPDSLVNEDQVSQYDLYISPIRNVIFDAGKTSRINVADFMADLVVNRKLWNNWIGKMPVIYNHL